MRAPPWIWLSVALNVALGLYWLGSSRPGAPSAPGAEPVVRTQLVHGPVRVVRTNIIVRAQSLTWREIESPDYFQYVANLRAIGCPEQTIRDIIIADVDALYARKRAQLVRTEHDEWWRSEPDLDALDTALRQVEELDRERRLLLAQLLGPNWDAQEQTAQDRPGKRGPALTGPVLSELRPETARQVVEGWTRLHDEYNQYMKEKRAAGEPPDPLRVAQMRREYREQLERLLTAPQLEEFLLRNSAISDDLRRNLEGFNTTPEEFRAIFRAKDAADRQLMYATVTSLESYQQQQAQLAKQTEAALERALGPERYREYKLNVDPIYRETRSLTADSGAEPEAVLPLYEIRKATAAEEAKIRANSALTPEEQAAALEAARRQSEAAIRQILGEDAYRRYKNSQPGG